MSKTATICHKDISARLQEARKKHYKSARAFAAQHGFPASTYYQHESGQRVPNFEVLQQYAELLKVDPLWLLTGSEAQSDSEASIEVSAEDERYITDEEFFEMLDSKPEINAITGQYREKIVKLDPVLFCQIILKLKEMLAEIDYILNVEQIVEKALEIHDDVKAAANSRSEQDKMVALLVTAFRRILLAALKQKQGKIS